MLEKDKWNLVKLGNPGKFIIASRYHGMTEAAFDLLCYYCRNSKAADFSPQGVEINRISEDVAMLKYRRERFELRRVKDHLCGLSILVAAEMVINSLTA